MKAIIRKASAACLFFLCTAAFVGGEDAGNVERYGLVIGMNNGGPGRAILKYAVSDAQAFSAVLTEMGGLKPQNLILLANPKPADIVRAFGDLKKNVTASRPAAKRIEFIFYYSGHADEAGLDIGREKLPFKQVRDFVSGVPADVRIAVIDACSSGVLIRTKGGSQQPPFLVDASADTKGYAFLTSSSAAEASQESDSVEGSFFTHYFVGGLRGAADVTKDGLVTLNESYQYAFDETLKRTEKSEYGPQHPSYDIQLSGSGDLVLTDLRETSARLLIEDGIRGRIFIRNKQGRLAAELFKEENAGMELGLAPGVYSALVDTDGRLRHAEVRLVEGHRTTLTEKSLKAASAERTVKRGKRNDKFTLPRDVTDALDKLEKIRDLKSLKNLQRLDVVDDLLDTKDDLLEPLEDLLDF